MPTLAKLTGSDLPDSTIDGKDVWDIIEGKGGAKNPHEYYPFSTGVTFEGVISGDGRWKLHIPHLYITVVKAGKDGMPGQTRSMKIGLSLFDMKNDPYETKDVKADHPEVLKRMIAFAKKHQTKFYPDQPFES